MKKTILALWYHELNFGDLLTPFLLEKLFDIRVLPLSRRFAMGRSCSEPFLIGCGSLLNGYILQNSYVWGSGILKKVHQVRGIPKKIYAVRGPKTRTILNNSNIDCPENYCDPAYLLSDVFTEPEEKKYKLGIIPHYVEMSHPIVKKLEGEGVKIISVQTSISETVKHTRQCENIASSSLHGIILADTFKIPRIPVKITDKVIGGDFKFLDYGESIGAPIKREFLSKFNDADELIKACEKIEVDLESKKTHLKKDFDPLIIKDVERFLQIPLDRQKANSLRNFVS